MARARASWLIGGLGGLLILTALMAGCRSQAPTTPPAGTETPPVAARSDAEVPMVGQPAPDFAVTDVDGKAHSLKDYHGRVLVLDFWATYCKPCVKKLREYESLKQAMKGKEVDFLALSSDSDDAVIKGWREENGITIALARLNDATRTAFFGKTQFVAIPQMRIMDRKGVIRYSFDANSTTAEVEEAIKTLLAEK